MANILINQKADRYHTYKGLLQINTGADTKQLKFIQELLISFDDSALERDFCDNGTPVWTRVGDVLGNFSFRLKDTVDLADTVTPSTNEETISYMLEQIASGDPPSFNFIRVQEASKSTGNKFGRLRYTGRVMKVSLDRGDKRGVDEAVIEGEITAITSYLREIS